ncbi:MAG: hypothetical protein PHV82_11570, partial [Victivallaceae bacterium]|nr:hypothetical protein [Victivallaceae bacterium]
FRSVQAFRKCPTLKKKYSSGWIRFPLPDEERLMVYDAVANGAKKIYYFSYPIEPWEPTEGVGTAALLGIPEAVALWQEIGRINLELNMLGPWLAKGCVSEQRTVDKVRISRILVGDDTVILVLVNTDYHYTGEKLVPTAKSFIFPMPVPRPLEVKDVFGLTYAGISNIKYNVSGENLALTVDDLKTSGIIIVTANPELKKQIAERRNEILKNSGQNQFMGGKE